MEAILPRDVYTVAALQQTTLAFREFCEVKTRVEEAEIHLRFELHPDAPNAVQDEFLNYALEISARELLSGGA